MEKKGFWKTIFTIEFIRKLLLEVILIVVSWFLAADFWKIHLVRGEDENPSCFKIELRETGDNDGSKFFFLKNDNNDIEPAAVGLQYLLEVTYYGVHITNIRLTGAYSKTCYLYDSSEQGFWLKRKNTPEYENVSEMLKAQISLMGGELSMDELRIEGYTLGGVACNNSEEPVYLLIYDNTVIRDISDDAQKVKCCLNGMDYPDWQEMDEDRIREITEEIIRKIKDHPILFGFLKRVPIL